MAVGKKLVTALRERGQEAVGASRSSGVNAVTGAGLADALAGAEVVVDASNSPSFEDAAALEFFETSTRNLLAAEADAGVRHHLVVSIVGADRVAIAAICVRKSPRRVDPVRRNTLYNRPRYAVL